MKKHLHRFFTLSVAVLMVLGANAQDFDLLLVEDFNVTQTQTPPAPWAEFVQDPADPALGGTSDGWEFGVTSYSGDWNVPASIDASGFAISNDDPDPSGNFTGLDRRDDQLLVGLFDLTQYDSLTILIDKFFNAQYGSDGFFLVGNGSQAVIFPVAQGAAWGLDELTVVNGETYVTAAGPLVFDNQMVIGFVHNDNGGWADGLAVDNVILAGWLPPCETTGLTQEPASPVAAVGGQTTTISASQDLGGEYSVVTNIQGSTEYVIDHTGGAYATVRTGSASGPVLEFGDTPLTITTLSTDDLYIIWSADNTCSPGDGSTNTSTITGGAQVCAAGAGSLFQVFGVDACLGDELVAAPGLAPSVPSGFELVYVVTDGAGNVVDGPFANPTYTPVAAGTYFIHTMVYDPADQVTILGQAGNGAQAVADLFEENGGQLCGSLDLAGAGFNVVVCPDNNDCEDATPLECGSAVAGTNVNASLDINTLGETVWYTFQGNGQDVTFSNCADGDFDSFISVWKGDCAGLEFLTGNDDGVNCPGLQSEVSWYAHPDTLYRVAVSGLSEGTTGTFTIEATCTCPAGLSEGSLVAAADVVCLDQNGEASLSAAELSAPGVPEGYGITYVLTSNPGLIIEDVSSTPDFTVNASGEYTIHTLVSANTLDLGVVQLGVTPASAVLGIVGGDDNICAALDVTGAPIEVPGAGTLAAVASPVCFDGNGEAIVSATHAVAPYVPAGYTTTYVLTMGANLVIMQAGANPEFTVTVAGDYTIHTLVHESSFDPLTVITPGVTTGGEVNSLLVQGGGAVCAALDVPGAPVVVDPCVVGITDGFAEGTVAVYPNPSNGQFVIEVNGVEGDAQIIVMDVAGRQVYTEGVTMNASFRTEVNLELAKGTYLLQIATVEGMVIRKIQID